MIIKCLTLEDNQWQKYLRQGYKPMATKSRYKQQHRTKWNISLKNSDHKDIGTAIKVNYSRLEQPNWMIKYLGRYFRQQPMNKSQTYFASNSN